MATATANKIKGYDASYYTVKDLERATKFYNELLETEPTWTIPGMVTEYTFPGGETFGLYKPSEGEWTQHGGVLFAVEDLQGAVEKHKARGVKFDEDGKIEESPVCFMAFAQDSEGNNIILHQHK
jgi:predicted enzyme related to lactoylglutathione lyase